MTTTDATVPLLLPPSWAILERQLIAAMRQSVDSFIGKHIRPDGSLLWGDRQSGPLRSDAFCECFHSWPLFYALAGGDHVLAHATHIWEGITRQLTSYGHLSREYDRGLDWLHQGERNLFFYYLCLADPLRPANRDRASRFAGFITGRDPEATNYDANRRLIRSPRTGSEGPRWKIVEGDERCSWSASMARYGLPFHDVPGITSYDDLRNPDNARRMGQVMQERFGKGDVVANLAVTSLVTNAYLLTGEERYRQWVLDYVEAWMDRAQQNGGLLPDNVGLSGRIGEYLGGKWYGGLYGWTWPHGFYNIAMAALIAAENALLLTGDTGYLNLPRTQIDRIRAEGAVRDVRTLPMSLREHWSGLIDVLGPDAETFVVPYRYGDDGWFDYQPLAPIYPTALWHRSLTSADWQRIEELRQESRADWNRVLSFRTKEDNGHEPPWLRFLAGANPTYPEEILRASHAQAAWRLDQIRADQSDLTQVNIHHWQQFNPVVTEALIQLTLGAPPPMYNGGLLLAPVRYFDGERRRPGLPPDVAALVTGLDADRVILELVNLSWSEERDVVIQAGSFGEHRFAEAAYSALPDKADPDRYPGPVGRYTIGEPTPVTRVVSVRDSRLRVHLAPGTRIQLVLGTERFVNRPSLFAASWD